jgi:hypothetical protein
MGGDGFNSAIKAIVRAALVLGDAGHASVADKILEWPTRWAIVHSIAIAHCTALLRQLISLAARDGHFNTGIALK